RAVRAGLHRLPRERRFELAPRPARAAGGRPPRPGDLVARLCRVRPLRLGRGTGRRRARRGLARHPGRDDARPCERPEPGSARARPRPRAGGPLPAGGYVSASALALSWSNSAWVIAPESKSSLPLAI